MVCKRCEAEAGIGTVRNGVFVCHRCCPLGRRCRKCEAGTLVYAPTPNDMGRCRCDRCDRVGHARRVLS